MNAVFHNWLDGTAMGASGLCLLHCLFLPLAILLIPAFSSVSETTEAVHILSLILVVPVSLTALGASALKSNSYSVLVAGAIALVILILGALFEHIPLAGIALTTLGSILLILCHLRNWQARTASC